MSRRTQAFRFPFQQDADDDDDGPLQEQMAILRSIETHHRESSGRRARSTLDDTLRMERQLQQALADSAATARRHKKVRGDLPQKKNGTFIDLTRGDDNPFVPPTKKRTRGDEIPFIDLTQSRFIERDPECSFQGSYGQVRITGVHNSGGGHCQYESIAQAMSFGANSSSPSDFQAVRDVVGSLIGTDIRGEIVKNYGLINIVETEPRNYRKFLPYRDDIPELRRRIGQAVRETDMWGDHMTLEYAASVSGLCFIVISRVEARCRSLRVGCDGSSATVVLLYDMDRHYRLAELDIPGQGALRVLTPGEDSLHAAVVDDLLTARN
jgi:hypothetical protein